MKLLKGLFLLLTLTSVLTSCSSDDNVHIPTNSEKIIGTWELNEFTEQGTTTTTVGTEDPIEATTTSNGETFTNTLLTYTSPNTLEASGSFLLVTTTTIGENEETNQEIADFDFSGNWKIEGDKLTVSNTGEDDLIYDIVSLTDTVLKLKITLEEETTIGSTVVSVSLTSNLSFEKK